MDRQTVNVMPLHALPPPTDNFISSINMASMGHNRLATPTTVTSADHHIHPESLAAVCGTVAASLSTLTLAVALYFLLRLISALRTATIRKRSAPFPGIPVVPSPHWLLGHLRLLPADLGRQIFRSSSANKKSGLISFWMFDRPCAAVLRSTDAQRVLRSSSTRSTLPLMSYHADKFLGCDSILIVNGTKWKASRNIVHKAFTPGALRDVQPRMNLIAERFVKAIQRKIDSGPAEGPDARNGYLGADPDGRSITLDYLRCFKMVTLDIFGETTLSHDFGCCSNGLQSSPVAFAFEYMQSEFTRRIFKESFRPTSQLYWLPTERNREHRASSALIRTTMDGLVRDRRQAHRREDVQDGKGKEKSKKGKKNLLDHLVEATDTDKLTDKMLSDTLMTLLAAGYETTSITLPYACYLLALNPKADRLLAEEARTVLGPTGRPISPDFDPNVSLPYTKAVILETLRLFPPATVTARNLEKPMEIDGVVLPTGTRVYVPIWWIQRHEHNFPEPERFEPQRWVRRDSEGRWVERFDDDDDDDVDRTSSEGCDRGCDLPPADRDGFVAFSSGARSCVGRRFAMQEATVILAACMRDLKMDAVPGYELVIERKGTIQIPKGGMPLITRRRE